MATQAWGQNAVIIEDDGLCVKWKPRCPNCGYVPVNRSCAGVAQEHIRAGYFERCDRCKTSIDVVISRG